MIEIASFWHVSVISWYSNDSETNLLFWCEITRFDRAIFNWSRPAGGPWFWAAEHLLLVLCILLIFRFPYYLCLWCSEVWDENKIIFFYGKLKWLCIAQMLNMHACQFLAHCQAGSSKEWPLTNITNFFRKVFFARHIFKKVRKKIKK